MFRAVRARRKEDDGRESLLVEKRAKDSLISASVAAEMPCSLASADWRGVFSFAGGPG